MNLYLRKHFNEVYWVTFILFLFCIRYIPLETRAGPSMIKIATSAICLFLLFTKGFYITRALMLLLLYVSIVFCTSYLRPQTYRWETILYLISFVLTYIYFYDRIVVRQLFTHEFFIKILRFILLAYAIALIIQQCALLAGFQTLPIINLTQFLDKGLGSNALSGEPSSAARVITVAMFCLVRMYEHHLGHKPTVKELYHLAKYPVLGYGWSILTIGSGTGFIALGLLALYFIQPKYICISLSTLAIVFVIIPYIEFIPLQRAYNTFLATLTLDKSVVIETDDSAAARVVPLINTLTNLDLFNWQTWFGHGVDYIKNMGGHTDQMLARYIGCIGEYGLISFIVMQITVYKCFIRKFLSLETLFWIILFGATFGNIAYTWGVIMLMTAAKHFIEKPFINNANQ